MKRKSKSKRRNQSVTKENYIFDLKIKILNVIARTGATDQRLIQDPVKPTLLQEY